MDKHPTAALEEGKVRETNTIVHQLCARLV